ncbi:MAG: methionyl-tRNA formyltransferase [Ramlibacter sp.]|nr:methionyl-tRNA formyltransferase [Ramlibacter sp.]
MKIAIIGQQDFGKAALEAFLARGDNIAGVFCQPEKAGAKLDVLREAAMQRNLPVFQFSSLRTTFAQDALRELNVDIGVMAYVLQFAPQEFVTIPKHGTIQFHPSLLPLHRGPSSINWPTALGARQTGLTIFRPTDGLDEGPVLLQKTCDIGPDETLGEVYFNKLFPMGVAALLEAADLIVAGKHEEIVQDESKATYEGWFTEEESRIHWANHADVVYNLIRACNPAPGAWTTLHGVKTWIYDCRKIPMGKYAGAHKPGDIEAVTETSIVIKSQGGMIEVSKLRAEGGKKMNAGEWARSVGLVASASSSSR